MIETSWLDRFPGWAIPPSLLAVLVAAAAIGNWLGVAARRRAVTASERGSGAVDEAFQGSVGTIVAATLGLFAFMLAFTFGAAADRYESRRLLVIKDANAIGTTYLRAEMLPDPEAEEAKRLLREYVDVRIPPRDKNWNLEENLEELTRRVDALHEALWAQAKTAAAKEPTPITALFVQSLNELIDVHAERTAVALVNRIPPVIWAFLTALGILSMTLTGYQRGLAGRAPRVGIALLALAFSMILALNVQIDRPIDGLAVSQAAMENLKRSMRP